MPRSNSQSRMCLLYDFKLGLNATESVNRINTGFSEGTIAIRDAQRWFKRFRAGNEDLEEMPRGTPPTMIDKEALVELIVSVSYQSYVEMTENFKCDESTVRKRLHVLGYTRKLDQWVPHRLTRSNKMARLSICSILHQHHAKRPFWKQIITFDEKWILHDNFRRSSSWVKKGTSPGIAPKPDLHPTKTSVTVWWNYDGIIHVDYLPPCQSINADKYYVEINAVQAKLRKIEPEFSQ